MKKYFTYAALIAATMLAAACGNKNEEEATSENVPEEPTSGISIAYVELDTLMSQYQLYKDYSEVLTRKGNNIQKTQRAQASIEKEQRDLAELADRLQNDFAMEQARINEEARDSIQSFLRRYNKTKKYDYVLVKAGDNLLIANPKYNITNDIVKGLNKRYKIKPEVAEQIKSIKESED